MSKIYDNKDITCVNPKCGVSMVKRMAMGPGRGDGQHRKGDIMVCSRCGEVQILDDSAWRPFAKADWERMPPQYQVALVSTVKHLRSKLQAGVEWSPYENQ